MTEELRSLIAVLTGCVELESAQAALLAAVCEGQLITTDELEDAHLLPCPPAARRALDASAALM
jgi:hypothetical protein